MAKQTGPGIHGRRGGGALVIALLSIGSIGGCAASAESVDGPATKTPYGYEFEVDSPAIVAAAPPAAASLPAGPGGRLSPESIQKVVRQNFGELVGCYEAGRGRDPSLKGGVRVKVVIGEDGITRDASDAGSTMSDKEVVSCVVAKFRARQYPESHGGEATVIYPVQFGS